MIRWSYLFPRLLLLAIITLVVVFALDPIVRWTLITMGQRATGAKVEIERLRSSLLRTAVRVQGVQLADPGHTDRNLLEADEITLLLDPHALLRRQWVVDRGHVRGLRFDTSRATSGQLETEPDEPDQEGGSFDWLGGKGQDLFDQTLGKLEQDVESLESVRLSRELMQRWPAEYDQVATRADELKRQVDQLRKMVEAARDNPLRGLESIEQGMSNIAALKRAPAELRAELTRLQNQIKQDRVAIDDARRRDMERIREELNLDKLDSESLVEYLVGDEWSGRIESVVGWLRAARGLADTGGTAPQVVRGRGENIIFPGLVPQPDFLIRSLLVEGEANIGRTRVPFAGTVDGISSQPKIYGRPTVCQLQSPAAGNLRVHAVVDQTGDISTTQIVIDCPQLPQPATTLGRPEQLAVDVAPGQAHLWARLELTGPSDLTGQILMKRDHVAMTPKAGQQLTDKLVTDAWQTAFQDVHNLHAAVDLSGTLTKPKWKLQTNLGPQLAAGLKSSLRRELAGRQEQLAAQLQQRTDQQLAKFSQTIAARQQELLAKLNLGDQEIAQLQQLIAEQTTKLPGLDLSRKLPFDKLLRR